MRQMPLNACTSEHCVSLQTGPWLLWMAADVHVNASGLNLKLLIHVVEGTVRLAVAAEHKSCPYRCPVVLHMH